MASRLPLILITRPKPDAEIFAKILSARGLASFCEPVLKIEPFNFSIPDLSAYQALLFTSANALRLFAEHCPTRKITLYVVGDNTKNEALAQGFSSVRSASGSADDLARLLAETPPTERAKPFLHVRGKHIAAPLDASLKEKGISMETLIVYEAKKIPQLSPACLALFRERKITHGAFFSRRSAENFMALAKKNNLYPALSHIKALCISKSVLGCLQPEKWKSAAIAVSPDRQGMLDLIETDAQKQDC